MNFDIRGKTSSIAWVATINPANFTPDWFKYNKILTSETCDLANTTINGNSVCCDFGWCEIIATKNKVLFRLTHDGRTQEFIDLVVSTISLMNTVKSYGLGLNSQIQVSIGSFDNFHKVGNSIIPKDIFYESNKSKLLDEKELHIGMISCRIAIEDRDAIKEEKISENKKNKTSPKQSENKIIYQDKVILDIKGMDEDENGIKHGIEFSFNHHIASIKNKEIALTELIPEIITGHFIKEMAANEDTARNIIERILNV